MITNPNLATQLAREHQRQMLAQASQQRHQHGRPVPGTPNAAASIIRRVVAAIARAGRVTAQAPGAIWLARPHPLGEPAAPARPGARRA